MKVLFVSPYSEKLVGGIVNWTKHIVNYHSLHCEEVDLRLLNNDSPIAIVDSAGLLKRFWAGVMNYMPVVRSFRKLVSKERFDIVHVSSSASFGLIRDLLIAHYARKNSVKVLVHMHFGRIPQILKTRGWERFLLIRLLKKIDCAVVMDSMSLDALQSAGFDQTRFLPNPLSSEVQELIESQGNLQREPRKVVFAGHVGAAKGVFELVEACRHIPDVKLTILGKEVEEGNREKLIQLAGKESEKWLDIPGNKSLREVLGEMMTCSVFVLPSHTEGFPNVILESMACGCPIVATPVGAIPEMLDADSEKPCGVIVPVNDSVQLRTAIERILDDPAYSSFISDNARKRVHEEYSMPKVWNQLVGIWREVTS